MIKFATVTIVSIASLWDLKTRRIPNIITLPSMVFALILNFYFSGVSGLGYSLVGLVFGILLLIIPFALKGIGAGDVKLLGVIGALNGPVFVFYTFLYSAIIGGIIGLGIASIRGQLTSILLNVVLVGPKLTRSLGSQNGRSTITSGIKFPYGITFLIGTAIAYWQGW